MLYQMVHTHTGADCPARAPEQTKSFSNWWQSLKKTSGLKVLAGYVSPLDHTFYITVETDDHSTLTRALGPLMSFGAGRIIPVLTLDQQIPIVEAGAYRSSK